MASRTPSPGAIFIMFTMHAPSEESTQISTILHSTTPRPSVTSRNGADAVQITQQRKLTRRSQRDDIICAKVRRNKSNQNPVCSDKQHSAENGSAVKLYDTILHEEKIAHFNRNAISDHTTTDALHHQNTQKKKHKPLICTSLTQYTKDCPSNAVQFVRLVSQQMVHQGPPK